MNGTIYQDLNKHLCHSFHEINKKKSPRLHQQLATAQASHVLFNLSSPVCPRSSRPQIWFHGRGNEEEERHARDDQHAEGLAAGAQEEPVPDERREDHAGHHHQDDPDTGLHLVRQRQEEAQEGEQDDVAAQEQGLGGEEI